MSLANSNGACKSSTVVFSAISIPEQLSTRLTEFGSELRHMISYAVKEGESFDSVERKVWEKLLAAGFQAMELFVKLQGNGDRGPLLEHDQQKPLKRSCKPAKTRLRSIFGQHMFDEFTYSSGKRRKIDLRPISARMQLPEHEWSYLLQEFSQMFCVDQAFKQSAENLDRVLGEKFSVDTLEQTNQRMGVQADAFLDQLPVPAASDESELLVASADCKGVPLIKDDVAKVAAFESAKKNPGNRRMATVTSAYTVDAYVRTPEQIVAALFRDERNPGAEDKKRPKPKHKHTMAHFPTTYEDADDSVQVSGIHEGMAWLATQVSSRHKVNQPLILLMDGQECLWNVAAMHFQDNEQLVEILDIIHVSTYVWEASSLFHGDAEHRATFTRDRLLKILQGDVEGVIRGLRRMGSLKKLQGNKRKDLQRICGYFEKHSSRMKYATYLKAGYPIASGVIEGACGHLVKDRMERSGMRWTLEAARSMLNVRAVFQSDYWDQFQLERIANANKTTHPNRNLISNYNPLTLAC